jgi:hypothetical protein
VEAILESHYELALRINYASDLALHVATSAGHLPIVKKLASAKLLQVKNNEEQDYVWWGGGGEVKEREGGTWVVGKKKERKKK